MHSEFCSWKLKKCNGNSEGNTIVISEMHSDFAHGNWKSAMKIVKEIL